MKKVLVLGAGGFIGSHLVKKLKEDGCWVRAVDLKYPEFWKTYADQFILYDLRDRKNVESVFRLETIKNYPIDFNFYPQPFTNTEPFDEVYQLAADMGGAGYLFTGLNDANIMHNSMMINLNVAEMAIKFKVGKLFYASSACVYPEHNQINPKNPNCVESTTYPANPDSEYGWEKLFSERLFLSYYKNYKLDIRIARFHNIYGPYSTYNNGKEKVPAAICRKVVESNDGDDIEVWGDGSQTRSFLYIDACIDKVMMFMRQNNFIGPVNIGSEEMVSINELAAMVVKISGKNLKIKNIDSVQFYEKYGYKCPIGVNGRNSDNKLFIEKMGTDVIYPLEVGINETYKWIHQIIKK